MNVENFSRQLRQKERELLADVQRLEDEARGSTDGEVRDSADDATSDQAAGESLQEGTMQSETLRQVRDALRRIDEGTYGKCVLCGRQIEAARLAAVPWTPYCLEDQQKQDAISHVPQGSSTL